MIEQRISRLSLNKSEFDKAKPIYQEALAKSGHQQEIQFNRGVEVKSNRKRNIIWFNPPYSQNVKTNVGRAFFALMSKHFPNQHAYHKLFNRNNLKLSYSCMRNMKTIIKGHNSKILNQKEPTKQEQDPPNSAIERECNCREKSSCPLKGKCLQECVVYKATIKHDNEEKQYIGMCEGDFKSRFRNHKKSFTNPRYKKETSLSQYIWKLQDNKTKFTIEWNILARPRHYTSGKRFCDLCLTEKYHIATAHNDLLINKKSEIISKCRHKRKHLLSTQ